MSSAPERARAKVTVGVCGGVAAYRAVELVRALQDAGLDPHVVMTASAKEFVTPLTFAAISGHKVIDTLWSGGEVPGGASSVEHIEQAQTTQALVIVPATANILGKLANGIADDFLTTMYLATKAPVIIAPAMNVVMWEHPAVQANVRTLQSRGVRFVMPGAGYLACGMEGTGRLAEIPYIVSAVLNAVAGRNFETGLSRQTVLITAGGTREPLDGVRFLGNRSSGRMGYALAEAAARRGARVILISASTALPIPAGVEFHSVSTASEMREKVLAWAQESTIVLKAAAVADFRPVTKAEGKIAREGMLTLELEPTEDIVAEVARRRPPGQLIVAFSAEMGEGLERARAKMLRKGVDAIVVNDVSAPGIGFDSDRNAGTMLIGARAVPLPEMTKREMAERILDEVVAMRHQP
ncbi:phosphopantothenoylcysteine decarboxylase / phosphopantothenate--cysteine ligase [Granulicella rosea]|uniref:Coenzyme A biosynthesis bifunctional protein CoaBC n=1 Tax=Granulicella rosea TaxID=474952 RepID=A0A239DS34_9BACT|nr:bifunctional phosphopantothenoylcysteine decarboxylase/phosphopantothenate--cysteine ligase CoaBC [Granulicella rosea]SNS35425.1 phosphopantothenoylcysteine decarboxylase / phosphopantothenate--cysteine ligase [Granulicella rosea]